jgi:hypothetical protein
MTKKDFKLYTDHIWKHKEYIECFGDGFHFDYPWYWGLKSKFIGSPEACDAMQNITNTLNGLAEFKTKKSFCKAYREELLRLGEKVK